MPSSYTTSARFTLQATGENNNTWGVILNSGVFQLVDDNVNGRLAFPLSGAKALTSNLGATDEARMAFLDVTGGTGGTVTIPAVSKGYFVRNAAAGDVTVSAGGPTNATFLTGDAGPLFSSGSAVYPILIGGKTIRSYIEGIVPAGPPMAGQAGKFLGNDGVNTALWQTSTPLTWSFGGVVVNKGASPPPAPIDASVGVQVTGATGAGTRVELNGFGSPPQLNGRHANGTVLAPTFSKLGDNLLVLGGRGNGLTGYATGNRASVVFSATEDWTDAAQGTNITFQTTSNGTAAVVARWQVAESGHFIPIAGAAYDIGSAAVPVRNIYTGGVTSTGTVVINPTGGAVPAPLAPDTLISGSVNGPARVEINAFGGAPFGAVPLFIGRAARGTAAAPAATAVFDSLAAIQGRGYGATGFGAVRAAITFQAAQNFTDTAQGARILVQTTTVGTTTPTDRWVFDHDGHYWPAVTNTLDVGTTGNKVRTGYFGTLLSVNQGATVAPAPIDAGTGFQLTGATGVSPRAEVNGINAPSHFNGRRANGTAAAPTPPALGDFICILGARGYAPSGWATTNTGSFAFVATENYTNAAQGTAIDVFTTPKGAIAPTGRWRFDDTGHFIPLAANTYDIGSPANPVRSIYSNASLSTTATLVVNLGPTAAPPVIDASVGLQITGPTGNGPRLEMNGYASAVQFNARRANGTAAAPTATLASDPLAVLSARGYGATGFSASNRVAINFVASENWTDAAQGTSIQFGTTANGTPTLANRWTIENNGVLAPWAANTYDIGLSGFPVRSGYFGTTLSVNQGPGAVPTPLSSATAQFVGQNGVIADLELAGFGNFARINGRQSNGTAAAPTATKLNDPILAVAAWGRGATTSAPSPGGQIFFMATENWTDTAHGTALRLQTSANGSTALSVRWDIGQDGHFMPGAAGAYDIGNTALPVRTIHANNISARLSPATVTTPTFIGNIPSMSVVYVGAGGQLRAHTSGSAPVNDGHIIFAGNFTGGAMTVVQDAGASLTWVNPAGAGLTGNRTVAFGGFITIVAMNTGWLISGTGIT
jgi:hypothetical protein